MLRTTAVCLHGLMKAATCAPKTTATPSLSRLLSSEFREKTYVSLRDSTESDDEFDARFENYFNRKNIDGWEVRQGVNTLWAYDLVPEPKILVALLKACRRINDYALAVRILEAVKDKCGNHKKIYPYIIQELQPTLDALGMDTPEELGYDKPELSVQSVYDM